MKKLTLSLAAIAAMGTFAVAGGDIAPVEPVVDTPVVAPSDAGFYVGGAYGYGNSDIHSAYTTPSNNLLVLDDSLSTDAFMLQGGYKVNPYFAVEARYWFVGDESEKFVLTVNGAPSPWAGDVDYETSACGIYVKPMYPVTDSFDIYALLGYGSISSDSTYTATGRSPSTASYDDGGFSWGLGISYDVTQHLSLFVDYVSIYDGSKDVSIPAFSNGAFNTDLTVDSWNFGVTYKF